jgi:hypothetical protein
MTVTNKQEVKGVRAPRATNTSSPKVSDFDKAQSVFRTLGLRYTTKVFRFCAENGLILDELREFTPKTHLDLVMLGTPNLDPDEAETAIDTFTSKTGLGMPSLHALCLEAANAAGFFMTVKDATLLGKMMEKKEDLLMLFLPMAAREMKGLAETSNTFATQ